MRIIVWLSVLTDHMTFTLSEVGRLAGERVIVFVRKSADSDRQAQGWQQTAVPHLEVRVIPAQEAGRFCLKMVRRYSGSIHIMAGAFWDPALMYCLIYCCYRWQRVYLMVEPYSPIVDGYQNDSQRVMAFLKYLARPLLYRFSIKLLRSRLTGVLAISRLAQDQYRRMGIPNSKIYPFGYFVPCAALPTNPPPDRLLFEQASGPDSLLRLIFVGTLIRRKGIDLVIDAVRLVNHNTPRIIVDFYGSGEAAKFEFDGKTAIYKSVIPFGMSQKVIARYDALVLPSRHDGWGVVVNEAICAGTPVICSSRCGAAELVERFSAGVVFDPDGDVDLAHVLRDLLEDPTALSYMRAGARTAVEAISPTVAAHYLLEILKGQSDAQTAKSRWLTQRHPDAHDVN